MLGLTKEFVLLYLDCLGDDSLNVEMFLWTRERIKWENEATVIVYGANNFAHREWDLGL